MPCLILRTSTSDPSREIFADCHCAAVEINPRLLELIRRRVNLARSLLQADPALYVLSFWQAAEVAFYHYALVAGCEDHDPGFEEQFDGPGFAWLPAGVRLNRFSPERTTCHEMLVKIDRCSDQPPVCEVAWTAMPKHLEVTITTVAIPETRAG